MLGIGQEPPWGIAAFLGQQRMMYGQVPGIGCALELRCLEAARQLGEKVAARWSRGARA